MNYLNKGKILGIFLTAALILASTAGLGAVVAAAQNAADKEIVTNSPLSGGFDGAQEVVYNIPGMILVEETIPQYPVNDQYQLLKKVGQKIYISDDNLLNSGIYLMAAISGGIKNISTTNGEALFLTNDNGSGWDLEANQSMSITIDIDLSAEYSDNENGELMGIGYYHDGTFTNACDSEAVKIMPGAELSFSATETGEYFWYIVNYCASMQNLASVDVTLD